MNPKKKYPDVKHSIGEGLGCINGEHGKLVPLASYISTGSADMWYHLKRHIYTSAGMAGT